VLVARPDGLVIVMLPAHGDAVGITGVGTMISGLRPAAPTSSVAVDGTVASL
jgi:hypothetical protein